jgi:Photosynthesis system II assembly factor YCF48
MKRLSFGWLFPALSLWTLVCVQAEDGWKIQFFYDKADSVFDIRDLACPSARRCVGAGAIGDSKGHVKGATVLTSDGGQHWTVEDFADEPVSLFFLNETPTRAGVGWMVAQHGIWKSEEAGRAWKKVAPLRGIVQVYFLDEMHGFAIGHPKAIYETKDGGVTWLKVPAALTPPGRPEDIIYDSIAFSGDQGVIIGRVAMERFGRYPAWLAPNAERTRQQKEAPALTLQTFDGGKTWRSNTRAFVGNISELRFTKEDSVVALVEYHDFYSLPSEVLETKPGAPGSRVVFGQKDRAVRDIALLPEGGGLIAAVEPPGNTNQVPIPSKLKMLRSDDLKRWEEMDVDYRAEALQVTIAAPDARHAFVATDTGMILGLEPKNAEAQKHLK